MSTATCIHPRPITSAVQPHHTVGDPEPVFHVGREDALVAGVARFCATARHVVDSLRRRRQHPRRDLRPDRRFEIERDALLLLLSDGACYACIQNCALAEGQWRVLV
jgi:hypothetical protein